MTERLLREKLEEAQERIRWLEDAIRPPTRPYVPTLKMSRTNETVLYALLTSNEPIKQEKLRTRIDVALDRFEPGDAKHVDIVIFRLRRVLAALDPSIKIRNLWGRGYWMDDESKARVLKLQAVEITKASLATTPRSDHI